MKVLCQQTHTNTEDMVGVRWDGGWGSGGWGRKQKGWGGDGKGGAERSSCEPKMWRGSAEGSSGESQQSQ